MSGLLRRSVRSLGSMPLRGGAHAGPIKPIGPNFPAVSEKVMGPQGWFKGSYTIFSLYNPIKGRMYRPPSAVGGIHNPVIDPMKHFNTQDRFETVTPLEYLNCFLWQLSLSSVIVVAVGIPLAGVLFFVWLEHRREPMEIFIDREEYWKDFDTWHYGVYYDHHHFSHMLAHRRAHKWGYAGLDYTLQGDHGHGGGHH
mmetsp:Transcript_65005/g.121069  ORF Transcript_65005/g.121069 Transcript_65005/m.121069 type:complete len:197 (-) Transcript_65005:136-726(-)